MTACLNSDRKEPDCKLSLIVSDRVGKRSSKQLRNSEVGMGSTK